MNGLFGGCGGGCGGGHRPFGKFNLFGGHGSGEGCDWCTIIIILLVLTCCCGCEFDCCELIIIYLVITCLCGDGIFGRGGDKQHC